MTPSGFFLARTCRGVCGPSLSIDVWIRASLTYISWDRDAHGQHSSFEPQKFKTFHHYPAYLRWVSYVSHVHKKQHVFLVALLLRLCMVHVVHRWRKSLTP